MKKTSALIYWKTIGLLVLPVVAFSMLAGAQITINGGGSYATIAAAVTAAAPGDVIEVPAGTYSERVFINKNNLTLRSAGGKAVTTINGASGTGNGTVMVASGTNGVTIGQPGKGFTIIGFDGNGAVETAAVYLLGSHTNITIQDNEIRANGEHGLLSNFNAAIDGIYIRDNMFTGTTFMGPTPGDCGFANQFVLGNNVPRQLVTMGGGAGVTNSKNVYFLDNMVTGTAGGENPACGISGQGNNLVTIDVIGCTISGNTFDGTTNRFASSLRTRGPGSSIACNTFRSTNLGSACTHIFIGSAAPLTGAIPGSLAGIAGSNSFPDGGAYLAPDNASSYLIYLNVAQANAAAATIGAGQSSVSAATSFGCPVLNVNTGMTFAAIQPAINSPFTLSGHTILAGPGLYNEDVSLNKSLVLQGSGAGVSTISGPIAGPVSTITVTASNAVIEGFTITRDGNNTTDWNNPALNSAGVAIQGLAYTGVTIRKNQFTGMRTAIDINNSNGHAILNNVIDFNRTGLIFRNQTDNMTVTENQITNNWTVGVLFLDASLGSNSPVQTALNGAFNNNNISGNWYGQIVDRQSGGSLPAPGTTNLKNFTCNWYGSVSPVVTTANSMEPGYSTLIPVAYGGAAVPPGGQPDIAGSASANFIYIPFLVNGTDNDAGTMGFQPVPGSCNGPAPKLSATINGVTVTSNANGMEDDNGTVVLCNTTNNMTFNAFSDVNGVTPASKVKAWQELVSLNNVTVPFCNNCQALLTAFPGAMGSVALVNPNLSGTLVIRFRAFYDINDNNVIDMGEPVDDWVKYTVQVDGTKPTFTRPADITIPFTGACSYNATVASTGDVTNEADDLSVGLNATYSDVVSQCGYNTVITRTWSLVDNCGNAAASQVQTITVTDNNTPYIIYAAKEVKFGEDNYINGDVGVTDAKGKAEFKKGDVLDPYYVRAKNIKVYTPSAVNNLVTSPATGGPNPPFMPYIASPLSGKYEATTSGPVPAGDFKELTIKKGVSAMVAGTNYGKVKVEEGASITFTASDINLEELKVEKGNSPVTTNVYFSTCASVRVRNKVDIDADARVNVGGPKVNVYVGDGMSDDVKFYVKGEDTYVTVNIMIPKGKLKVSGGYEMCIMTGWFIVEKLESEGKNITWNKYGCVPFAPARSSIVSITPGSKGQLNLNAYPNPSGGLFTVKLNTTSKTSLLVINANGRIIERRVIPAGAANQTIPFNLGRQAPGIYTIRIVTSEGVQTSKIIIQR